MSLFAPKEEKTLSFDEYIASFDTNQIAKVQQFVDWLGQYRGELVHNPWGEVNSDLEIVRWRRLLDIKVGAFRALPLLVNACCWISIKRFGLIR